LDPAARDDRALIYTDHLTIFQHIEAFRIAGIAEVEHCGCHGHVVFRYNLIL
jgi:hypothetical protein